MRDVPHVVRPLHNPSIVIASEAKQSHNTLISHKIATSLCSSQWPELTKNEGCAKLSQSFCYNVKTFYSTKSHDKTLSRRFYRVKLPYFSFSQAIMHENKSGF